VLIGGVEGPARCGPDGSFFFPFRRYHGSSV
jgi:hypothetical protein